MGIDADHIDKAEMEAIALRWCALRLKEYADELIRKGKRDHIVSVVLREAVGLDRRFNQEADYVQSLKGTFKDRQRMLDGEREINL